MEPLISVIVPVYKVEQYLHQCVDSILNQTYHNLEVILVDDGSPDSCPAICDEYAEMDHRVRVIHKVNGGLSDARNAGMAVMNGEYLSFVDSDDLLPVDAIETMIKIALEENADLVIGGHNRFEDIPTESADMETFVQRWTPAEAMADMLRNGCASWARLYRRELHKTILFPVGEINEDEAIVLPLLEKCKTIAVTNAVVYYYRCRPESITTTVFNRKKMVWVKHCRDNLTFIRERYPELEADAAARYRGSLLWTLSEIALCSQDFTQYTRQLIQELKDNRQLFMKTEFAYPQDRIRMLVLMYLPFKFYKQMLRIKRGIKLTGEEIL